MKRLVSYLSGLWILFIIIFPVQLFSHGLGAGTWITQSVSRRDAWTIQLICENALEETEYVASFDFKKNKVIKSKVTSVGTAQTNSFYAIRFNNESWDDIVCTPDQEFYVPSTKRWIPAHRLQIGDLLLTQDKSLAQISQIQFHQQAVTVYAIRVKKTHNYFAGRHRVLTHNLIMPLIQAGIGAAFGTGAAAGGTAGSFLGPVIVAAGAFFGGLAGISIKTFFAPHEVPRYEISYDVHNFNHLAENQERDKEKQDNTEELIPMGTCGGSPDPEDPNDPWRKKQTHNNFNNNNNRPAKITNKMALEFARKLGFEKTNYYSKGQAVFKKGKLYITIDVDGHNGGFWKMANSVENLASKATRLGTYDQWLNRIGN